MPTSDQIVTPPREVLTEEETLAYFDATARKHLQMSGTEYLRRFDEGAFDEIVDDPSNHPWVGYLAQLSRSVR